MAKAAYIYHTMRQAYNEYLIDRLSEAMKVTKYENLWETTDYFVKGGLARDGPFDLIISNFPGEFTYETRYACGPYIDDLVYSKSSCCISRIARLIEELHHNTGIVIYSAAPKAVLDDLARDVDIYRFIYREENKRALPEFAIHTAPDWRINLPDFMEDSIRQGFEEVIRSVSQQKVSQEFIKELLLKLGLQEGYIDDWMEKNADAIELMPKRYHLSKGYTGNGVIINEKWALKLDAMPRIGLEHTIYSSSDFGDFSRFTPKIMGFDKTDDCRYGALILENLLSRDKSGFALAQKIALGQGIRLSDMMDFNLYLMGLFHKSASKDKALGAVLSQVGYEDKRGFPHHLAGNIPLDGISDSQYKRYQKTLIKPGKIKNIIEQYNDLLESLLDSGSLSVIHGDWKPENMVNGYLVDFAMVGFAGEVDELAYYLSDARLRFSLPDFHDAIDRYIGIRNMHDPEFKLRMLSGQRRDMHKVADSAFLRQLVLRHSVMNKRNMLDPEKYAERQYYQAKIDEVVKGGRFI